MGVEVLAPIEGCRPWSPEDPACGDRPWRQQWVRRLHKVFRDMHWNSARYCIGFPPEKWYDIADEEGLMVDYWAEPFPAAEKCKVPVVIINDLGATVPKESGTYNLVAELTGSGQERVQSWRDVTVAAAKQ
jgi:hypothetical protein